jgi:hypothetical protein
VEFVVVVVGEVVVEVTVEVKVVVGGMVLVNFVVVVLLLF